ncbi:MAG: hypothetical protein ACKV2O_13935 [Acidimicrobiales bacterium]
MRKAVLAAVVTAITVGTTAPADAAHSWGGYHWARTANPFSLRLGDNVNSTWDPFLRTTSTDWSVSTVLDTVVRSGSTTGSTCAPTSGTVQVCNASYGANGWLGIAQVWVSGTHIVQGTTKLNDTYFNSSPYNTTAWRNLVMCQEVGHTLGLNHQDENFTNANLGSCMDYTNSPGTNQRPNAHDYQQLLSIYGHADTTSTLAAVSSGSSTNGASAPRNGLARAEWGELDRGEERSRSMSRYHRRLPDGTEVFSFVIWA